MDVDQEIDKLLAFYMGEDEQNLHPIEKEYRELADKPKEERSSKEVQRLVLLAKALSEAADASHAAFKDELDKLVEIDTIYQGKHVEIIDIGLPKCPFCQQEAVFCYDSKRKQHLLRHWPVGVCPARMEAVCDNSVMAEKIWNPR